MDDHSTTLDHIVNTGKVMAGGAGVGGTTFIAVSHMSVEQATAWAGLAAGCMTTVYFAISAAYALWKWRKEANGK